MYAKQTLGAGSSGYGWLLAAWGAGMIFGGIVFAGAARARIQLLLSSGTLAIGDHRISRDFYANVLGLEVHQANPHVVYIKHPKTKCYVVCAERKEWKVFSDNFRFTLAVESQEAVAEAHRWLSQSGKELGVTDLGPIRQNGTGAFFLLRDPDRNCWEVTSPH